MDRAPGLQDFPGETTDKPGHEGPGYDYKEIAREVLARIDQRLADLEETPPDPSEAQFVPERASGTMSSDDQATFVRLARRGLIGLLLSAVTVAAISFLWSHRDSAIWTVTQRVPQLILSSMMPAEKPEPGLPAVPKAIADAVSADVASPPLAAPNQDKANQDKANPAPVPAELAELMLKVDRNLAGLAQAVTQLRLAHQQTIGDNAKTVKDIRASLDQMARAIASSATASSAIPSSARVNSAMARAPDQVTQAKPPALAPLPATRRNRRYVPPYLSPSDALGYMR